MNILQTLIITVMCLISFNFANETTEIEVEARLIEVPGTLPANDLYNYVYVVKYKVQKVIQGELKSKEIFVGHYNPLIPRAQIKDKMDTLVDGNLKNLKKGQKHLLKLKLLEESWEGPIEDEFFDDEESPRYFATYADLLP